MKKFIFLITLGLLGAAPAKSQTPQLWGTMSIGGFNFIGNIFKINGDGSGYGQVYALATGSPQSSLLPADGSVVYGVTVSGGDKFLGEIFEYNSASNVFTSLYSLDSLKGYYPRGNLCLATDNKLYGLTSNGGVNDLGVLFSFDPATNSYIKLHEFDNLTGQYPNGAVVEAGNGKLYGMTTSGGTAGGGVIFSFDISSNTFNVVYNFAFAEGFGPFGSLINGNDGLMYGMAFGGGSTGYGVIFKFNPANNNYQVIHHFSGTDGAAPWAALAQSDNGTLYGTTSQGGANSKGVLFRIDPSGSNFSTLHDFEDATGSSPWNGVMVASDGNLYGMTTFGGANSFGVIYSYNVTSGLYSKLHDCDLAGGGFPYGDLVEYYPTTGIDELASVTGALIYPNPAQTEFSVALKAGITLPLTLQISDVNGKLMKEIQLGQSISSIHAELPPGLYFIALKSNDGVITQKIVVE